MATASKLLTAAEIKSARLRLGLTYWGLAAALAMIGSDAPERIEDWERGRRPITGPASQALRLWLAVRGLGETPELPRDPVGSERASFPRMTIGPVG